MKINKLPSGNYNLQKQINGKRHSITFDHKPSKREIDNAVAEIMLSKTNELVKKTFEECALQYIDSRENVSSPSTLRGYRVVLKNLSNEFKRIPLKDIEQLEVQLEINDQAKTRSPKSVRNVHGFISAVLKMYKPELVLRTTLPQKSRLEGYIPTSEDIHKLLEFVYDTKYYVPFKLGCYSLRRSEICCLKYPDDFDGNYVHISRALVLNSDNEWVEKSTKTTDSDRTIYIDDELLERIKKQGYVYRGHPNMLTKMISEKEKQCGLPHFRFHDLRHYFATELSQNGQVSEADILALGGWSRGNSSTMKRVYRHSRAKNDMDAMKNISEIISDSINNPVNNSEENADEMQIEYFI